MGLHLEKRRRAGQDVATFSAPPSSSYFAASAVPAERPQDRIFLHMLGGLLSGGETTTTVGPSTTKATLYGDLVNLWDMLFGEKDSTTTELTFTTTATTTTTTTTTTTKCGGIFGGGLGLGCPQ